ncbi:hypothetical protein V2G26_020350 [Clonostachys chloroleuca]
MWADQQPPKPLQPPILPSHISFVCECSLCSCPTNGGTPAAEGHPTYSFALPLDPKQPPSSRSAPKLVFCLPLPKLYRPAHVETQESQSSSPCD